MVDSSAVVAILFGEASAPALLARLVAKCGGRIGSCQAIQDLDAFLAEPSIALAEVDAPQGRLALSARIRFGRGMGHGGVLNLATPCCSALARTRDAPLLFIGDDFGTADVTVALVLDGG